MLKPFETAGNDKGQTITVIDAPDYDPEGFRAREGQRSYRLTDPDADKAQTVRISRDPGTTYQYVVENLVAGKWHKLLLGETEDGGFIPFDAAAWRAVAILF